jgi:hypothetical protein
MADQTRRIVRRWTARTTNDTTIRQVCIEPMATFFGEIGHLANGDDWCAYGQVTALAVIRAPSGGRGQTQYVVVKGRKGTATGQIAVSSVDTQTKAGNGAYFSPWQLLRIPSGESSNFYINVISNLDVPEVHCVTMELDIISASGLTT